MNTQSSKSAYVLGNADAEHERLIRQGAWLAPITERLFRAAGIAGVYAVHAASSGLAGWVSDRWIIAGASPNRVRKTLLISGLIGVAILMPLCAPSAQRRSGSE